MPGGKDLRNKIIVVNGEAYTFGGNMLLGEKFSVNKNAWVTLSSYNELLEDNLDSWACTYTFDIPGYRESLVNNDDDVDLEDQNINYQHFDDDEVSIFGHNYFDHELGVLENVRNMQDDIEPENEMYMDDVYYGNDYLEDAYEEDDGYY